MFFPEGHVVAVTGSVRGKIWWADPMNVVRDSAELTVLYLGPGARYQMPDRVAALSPQQRHSSSSWAIREADGWTLVERPWRSTHVLTFLYPNKYFAIRMFFAEEGWRHICWYVNFQRPYVRTALGFEALDLALDIVVTAHDASALIAKDEEQYLTGIEQGGISNEDVAGIAQARSALADLKSFGMEPFLSDWRGWRPREGWPAQVVPIHNGSIEARGPSVA